MKYPIIPYRIFPLGDAALTVAFNNHIDDTQNDFILQWVYQLQGNPPEGMIEVTPAFNSFTVYYDVMKLRKSVGALSTGFEIMKQQLEEFMQHFVSKGVSNSRLIDIPVCYDPEFSSDIEKVSVAKQLSREEIISIHLSRIYKIHFLGFLPGFAYMGQLDERIAIPRKNRPESISSGCVGIAGSQTGVYPLASPGGWHIIGKTPIKLFDKEKKVPVFLKPGDRVRFYSISRHEFENY